MEKNLLGVIRREEYLNVMDEKIRPVWAEVNLDQLRENVKNVKERIHGKKITAIVKADAYGHGAGRVALAIEAQVDCFGVAIIDEAMLLRKIGIKKPIMVLSYTPEAYFRQALDGDFILNALSYEYAKDLDELALSLGRKAKVFVAVDTGMERMGCYYSYWVCRWVCQGALWKSHGNGGGNPMPPSRKHLHGSHDGRCNRGRRSQSV